MHALETLHALLEPDGCLIDLHPSGQPPPIEAWIAGLPHLLGYMQETDDFIEYAQAATALAEIIQSGLFELEQQGAFMFVTRADSVEELHAFLNENWSDAVLPAEIEIQADRLSLSTGPIASVQLCQQVHITRLRKTSPV